MESSVEEKNKRVFISYSWTNAPHEKWVLELAERLVSDGVDVILDKWDLKQGQDKYAFMESMVQDATIDKVLIICDRGYKEKADIREGGVGTETQIITPALYGKVAETRYIPIIAEEGENAFDEYMPNYIKSRIGIAMSSPSTYLKGYEELLRVIYDKPRFVKPKLGKKPSFLDDRTMNNSKLRFLNDTLCKYIEEDRKGMIISFISDFKEEFFNELDEFIINMDDFKQPYNEQLLRNIDEMLYIRDEYIRFIENLIKGYDELESDIFIDIFEKMYHYTEYNGNGSSYSSNITEHYKFFITETFLWTNIMLFKYRKYKLMHEMLYTKYFVETKYRNDKLYFENFRYWLDYLEENQIGDRKKLSICADKLIERAIYDNKNYKNELINIDILLYYISKAIGRTWPWFPVTYVYRQEFSKIRLIEKMERKKYFDEIKILFNVENESEMKKLIEEKLSDTERGYQNSFSSIPSIKESINIDEIGKN
ncbi:SEFIR domain-containing protein [Clostridium butyricum]|uniref:SEFIR domain-containing protein n=1 Tax=Clostridium butyricum TaxID=1492 RepID=UPI00374E3EA0